MNLSLRQTPRFLAVIIGLHIVLLGWVTAACLQVASSVGPYYALASFLGLGAFTLMWLHYLVGWLHDRFWPETSLRTYMKSTSLIVLVAMLAHPILIVTIFYLMGLGLPPASYAKFAGSEVIFVYVGISALIGFLLFETRRWLYGKPVWSLIASLSHMAMLLILVHGWRLGLTLQSAPGLQVLWVVYLVGYIALLLRLVRTDEFRRDFATIKARVGLLIAFGVAMLATLAIVIYSFVPAGAAKTSESETTLSQAPTSASGNDSTQVTAAALHAKNGKNGTDCWVAVDGSVYQIVSNEWRNGQHLRSNEAYCGADMSDVIKRSPHGKSVLGEQTVVGTYAG